MAKEGLDPAVQQKQGNAENRRTLNSFAAAPDVTALKFYRYQKEKQEMRAKTASAVCATEVAVRGAHSGIAERALNETRNVTSTASTPHNYNIKTHNKEISMTRTMN
jgi:hypothetical protein